MTFPRTGSFIGLTCLCMLLGAACTNRTDEQYTRIRQLGVTPRVIDTMHGT